jgi:hypothetical protein
MVNGPCGGTNNGKCEIDSNKDCAWTLIYNRLKELGRLDCHAGYQKPRNHLGEPSRENSRLEAAAKTNQGKDKDHDIAFKKRSIPGRFVVTCEVAPPKGTNLEKSPTTWNCSKTRWMP